VRGSIIDLSGVYRLHSYLVILAHHERRRCAAFIGGHNESAPEGEQGRLGLEPAWWTAKGWVVAGPGHDMIVALHGVASHYAPFAAGSHGEPPFGKLTLQLGLDGSGTAIVEEAAPWFAATQLRPHYEVEQLFDFACTGVSEALLAAMRGLEMREGEA